jgi:hypothetical protein
MGIHIPWDIFKPHVPVFLTIREKKTILPYFAKMFNAPPSLVKNLGRNAYNLLRRPYRKDGFTVRNSTVSAKSNNLGLFDAICFRALESPRLDDG